MKDIEINSGDLNLVNGHLITVSKEAKLNQQLRKILLTTIGFYLHQNYGSNLIGRLGRGQGSDSDGDIKADIRTAMDYFIFLQQPKVRLQAYEAEEILYKVLSINVEHPDPRAAYPTINVMNAAQNTVEFQLVF